MKTIDKKDEILKMMQFLEDYVVLHFGNEEAIQLKYNYPLYVEHAKIHAKFIADIKLIKKDIEVDGITVATGLIIGSTLSNWLISHISKMDKELGNYIRKNFDI